MEEETVGLFSMVMNVAKARMVGRVLQRGLGGKLGTALMVAYLGKKAYDIARAKRHSTEGGSLLPTRRSN